MNNTNTIIKENISDFLEDLDIPTYIRNEVKQSVDQGDLATATQTMSNYFSTKNLNEVFSLLGK